ncbi:Hypothetical_protein [Hexamita inflata]|uniref:Hypothetical_protein n=1 Tax=Hexamita inflata TaxID=28002 RepID=A0AA86NU34_9EUKA|nr:Hypothetical protein HINF_LOCUS12461 [Hexamita inflata]
MMKRPKILGKISVKQRSLIQPSLLQSQIPSAEVQQSLFSLHRVQTQDQLDNVDNHSFDKQELRFEINAANFLDEEDEINGYMNGQMDYSAAEKQRHIYATIKQLKNETELLKDTVKSYTDIVESAEKQIHQMKKKQVAIKQQIQMEQCK